MVLDTVLRVSVEHPAIVMGPVEMLGRVPTAEAVDAGSLLKLLEP